MILFSAWRGASNLNPLDSFGVQIRYNRLPNWLGRVFMVFLSFQFINMDFIPRQNIFQYSSKCCKQRKGNILWKIIQKLNLIYWTTSSGFDEHSTIPKTRPNSSKSSSNLWILIDSVPTCSFIWILSHPMIPESFQQIMDDDFS